MNAARCSRCGCEAELTTSGICMACHVAGRREDTYDEQSVFVLDGSEFFEDPSEALSRLAAEQFLDWPQPPPKIVLHRLGDGKWGVEALGGSRV